MPARWSAVAPLVLALAMAGNAFAQTKPKPAPVEPTGALREAFASGIEALRASRLDEAEAAFRRVVDGGAGVAAVHHNLGIVLQQRGDHAKAVAEFREAIRLDGTSAAPRILLGASLVSLGRAGEARAELRKAVKLAPGEPLARLQLARADQSLGDWTGAVEQYRALVRIDPKDPEYRYGLGTSYLRLSEETMRELQRTAPGSARVQQALGHNLRVQGKPEEALAAFARAAEADPSLPEIHLAMAQIHMEQGRYAEARREAEREAQIVPESAGARAMLQRVSQLEAGGR